MRPLKNPRHEAFAQALFKQPQTGMSQGECYSASGYKARGHSAEELGSRLSKVEEIRNRVADLQTAVAKKSEITVESICAELDEANAIAKERGQAGAMVSASTLRAKLAGLLQEKVEITAPKPFSQCQSFAEMAEELLRDRYGIVPTQEQIKQGEALMRAQMAQWDAEWDALAKGRAPIIIDAAAEPIGSHPNPRSRQLARLPNH